MKKISLFFVTVFVLLLSVGSASAAVPQLTQKTMRLNIADFRKSKIPLDLLGTAKVNALIKSTVRVKSGVMYSKGEIENKKGSVVSMITKGDRVTANIYVPNEKAVYEIRYSGSGNHSVKKVNQLTLGNDREIALPANLITIEKTLPKMVVGPANINVMVLYTADAKNGAGGKNQMEDEIDLAVAEANMAYENSGILQKLNLVRTEEIAYTEQADTCADLAVLASTTDKVIDNIHALRTKYRADIVTLFVNTDRPSSCGCGYVMNESFENFSFAPYAFNAVKRSCIPNLSYAHELGHNMGAVHDKDNADNPGRYDFSYGYQDPGAAFRTVMAYDCPAGCVRVPVFSGPNVTYDNKVAGVANSADNVKTLNNTRFTVAQFTQDIVQFKRINLNQALRPLVQSNETGASLPAGRTNNLGQNSVASRVIDNGVLTIGETADERYVLGSTDDNKIVKQEFKLPKGALVDSVTLRLGRANIPTQALRVSIFDVDAGKELGLATITSASDKRKIADSVDTDESWYNIKFRKAVAVDATHKTQLIVQVAAANSVRHYLLAGSRMSYPDGALTEGGFLKVQYDLAAKINYHALKVSIQEHVLKSMQASVVGILNGINPFRWFMR